MPIANEEFWEDLIDLIEGGNVLPVVGQGATTMGADDTLLAPWLAGRLAEKLNLNPAEVSSKPSLNEVICRYLVNGGERDKAYTRIFRILRDEAPLPGKTLERLASIRGFQLFISTMFDPLLEQALNSVRHGGQPTTRVCAYSPEAETKDLPARKNALNGSMVYHVLGKVSQSATMWRGKRTCWSSSAACTSTCPSCRIWPATWPIQISMFSCSD